MSEVLPGVVDGSFLSIAHPMVDLCEGMFDRVEVGRVGGQEPQSCAGVADRLADGLSLVAAEVVEDDEVAGPERGDEELLDPGLEAWSVDRAVEDIGCAEPVRAQPGEEGHGAPAAVRCEALEALSLLRPAAQRGHVGLDPGLVHEHQAVRLQPALERLPSHSLAGHRGAGLLKGEQGVF